MDSIAKDFIADRKAQAIKFLEIDGPLSTRERRFVNLAFALGMKAAQEFDDMMDRAYKTAKEKVS